MSPPTIKGRNAEREAVLETAKFMLVATRTAPKTAGIDDVVTSIVYGEEKDAIADMMDEIAVERKIDAFRRDAENVRDSEAVVLIGVKGSKSIGLGCGGCGWRNCEEFESADKKLGRDFVGPTCIFKALDLGIALGSAAKTASMLNVDNRIIYRIGTAAMKLKSILEATVMMGIPISAKGKNVYFDRVK